MNNYQLYRHTNGIINRHPVINWMRRHWIGIATALVLTYMIIYIIENILLIIWFLSTPLVKLMGI